MVGKIVEHIINLQPEMKILKKVKKIEALQLTICDKK